jgi:hypothetical protein
MIVSMQVTHMGGGWQTDVFSATAENLPSRDVLVGLATTAEREDGTACTSRRAKHT